MASACVNKVAVSPESSFIDLTPTSPAYGWLSPRISFGRDTTGDGSSATLDLVKPDSCLRTDPESSDVDLHDFEFRLDDPIAMLPADELFSDGKLVPLQLAAVRPRLEPAVHALKRDEAAEKSHRMADILSVDACARSPGAPKCSSRWRELLGLRKVENPGPESQKLEPSSCTTNPNASVRSIRQYLLRRHHKFSGDRSVTLPLLGDSDVDSVCISSRRSLSSSSSSSSSMADHDDLPRFSLDVEKPTKIIPISFSRPPPRVRSARTRATADGHHTATLNRNPVYPPVEAVTPLTVSADSPRMSACGKVVFQGLGRSSSSPGSFIGGYRAKYRPMERSYSAGVRVAPVLNVAVPVRSLRGGSSSSSSKGSAAGSVFGFGQLFSSQKKAGGGQNQIKIKPTRY